MASLTSKLNEQQLSRLYTLLGEVELNLLYKASVHGYAGQAFHQRCDRQGPTVVVAYSYSGYVFGGYTSKDYAQTGQYIDDEKAFLFSLQDPTPVWFRVMTAHGARARLDDASGPRFGDDMWFCYNNCAQVYCNPGNAYMFNTATMYGNNQQLIECEVYKVTEASVPGKSVEKKPWRNILWTAERRAELMESVKTYKPLISTVKQLRILMIGPVGAGKSSFFNSINSIFCGHVTSKAMSGSLDSSITKQYRTYTIRAGNEGVALPFILCDTMGLEEASEAGLSIDDISSAINGHIPDRYKFNPAAPYEAEDEVKPPRSLTLQDKVHCVVYVLDTCKVTLMPSKVEEKLTAIRKRANLLGIPQIVLLTKVDEACPLVEEDLQNIYLSSYIKTKVREASARVGVSMSSVIPVKNYSHELELELECDILLLTAIQQMLRFADNYFDDMSPGGDNVV
ncbi:interferon-induced protein 44-like [Electrophorus electricus]|uniref:Si:ch211-197g15.5 n=1 Tax=Electrophorus electricus TaxID=8005 RepID=A0A4W4GB07_ELEEL|nr:interferon-induced protein 44-like [Electrophorus electricus]